MLNLARLVVLIDEGQWLSKLAGAEAVRVAYPGLAPVIAEALTARAEKRWTDPSLGAQLSALLRQRLG